ncbi:MAG: Phage terminase, small subunit [Cyanobacteriota bacterium]
MSAQLDFPNWLSQNGRQYFELIKAHVSQIGILEIDEIEIAMLANEYDLYFSNLEFCQREGYSFQTGSNNGYSQIRPEFTVMKNAYQNILKHSGKFGMNPADRAKMFGGKLGVSKKPKTFDI